MQQLLLLLCLILPASVQAEEFSQDMCDEIHKVLTEYAEEAHLTQFEIEEVYERCRRIRKLSEF